MTELKNNGLANNVIPTDQPQGGYPLSRGLTMTKRAYGLAGLALFLLAVLIAQRSGWL